MIDYEETKEDAMISFRQQIKQLVEDAFDKGYQCGYKDGYQCGDKDHTCNEFEKSCITCIYSSFSLACATCKGYSNWWSMVYERHDR